MEQSRQISIGGNTVWIIDLDEIFAEIKASGVKGDNALKQLIFDKVKVRNYIPNELEDVYREGFSMNTWSIQGSSSPARGNQERRRYEFTARAVVAVSS